MKEREIFDAALAIDDPRELDSFLNAACGADAGLKNHLRGLLDAERGLGSFLESPAQPPMRALVSNPTDERLGTAIGLYTLVEILGEGGMGTVYRATQERPVRREVALKVIKPGMDSKQVIARFEAERQALAMMDHPNIARVIDGGTTPPWPGGPGGDASPLSTPPSSPPCEGGAGTAGHSTSPPYQGGDRDGPAAPPCQGGAGGGGRPYFVMELVRGIPITEYCDQERLPIRERLELFVLVCRAVQHAHQKGIIHRDIKPSNVLVMEIDGAAVPKVIDFGVAKAIGDPLTGHTRLTAFHQFLGTPLYMSPEQAAVSGVDVDTRSDIYSLGVLLYELLTGTTPFEAETLKRAAFDEMRRIIREEEPPRPSTRINSLGETISTVSANRKVEARQLDRTIRGELDWIVMKCLEKDRTRRYETASGLIRDVERFLDCEPVEAGPPSAWYRLRKRARRNRAVLTTTAIVAIAMILGIAVSARQAMKATESERRAEAHATSLEWQLYVSRVNRALAEWTAANVEKARELLEECPVRLRRWEWNYCERLCRLDSTTLRGHHSPIIDLRFSTDGEHVFSMSAPDGVTDRGPGEFRVWSVSTGRVLLADEIPVPTAMIAGPIDDLLIIRRNENFIIICEPSSDEVVHRLPLSPEDKGLPLLGVSSDASGNRILMGFGSFDIHLVELWNLEDDMRLNSWIFRGHEKSISSVAISPDGARIALGGQFGEITLLDSVGQSEWTIARGHTGHVFGLAFSPDGTRIASAGWDRMVRVWNSVTGELTQQLPGHTSFVRCIDYSPDGTKIASAGEDGLLKIWNTHAGQELATLRGHTGFISRVAFSPDGTRIATGGYDATVKLWDLTDNTLVGSMRHSDWVTAVCFSPDSTLVASASRDRTSKLWDAATGKELATLEHAATVNGVAFRVFGDQVATACWDGKVHLWSHGEPTPSYRTFGGHDDWALSVACSPDGKRIVSGGKDRMVRQWDAATGRELMTFRGHDGAVIAVCFSPKGGRIASAGLDQTIKVWDPGTGEIEWTFECESSEDALGMKSGMIAFSPDGRRIAACNGAGNITPGQVRVWDLGSGELVLTLDGHSNHVNAVTFSPDGARIASASNDQTVKLWDAVTGEEIITLSGHGSGVLSLAFSPDGRRLATGSIDNTVRIWDASSKNDQH